MEIESLADVEEKKDEEDEEAQLLLDEASTEEGDSLMVRRLVAIELVLEKLGTTPLQWKCCVILGFANAADAVEILAIGYIITVYVDPESGKHIDELAWASSLLTSAVFVGMLIGGLLSGSLGDRYGRKHLLAASLFANGAAGVVSALTLFLPAEIQIPWLICFRFLGGLGVGGSVPSAFALASEIGPERSRSLFINVVAAFWTVGMLFASLCAFLVLGAKNPAEIWPLFAFLVGIPALVTSAVSIALLKESPRFLVSKGRYQEAKHVLDAFLHSARKNTSAEVFAERQKEIKDCLACPEKERNSARFSLKDSILGVFANICKLLNVPELRRIAFLVCCINFFLSFAHYGVSSWISDLFLKVNFTSPFISSIFFSAATVPGLLAAIFLVDILGRRRLTAISMVLACLSALMFSLNTGSKAFVLGSAALFNTFATCTWNSFDIFSAELFPVEVRGTGLGLSAALGRIGSITSNFFNSFVLSSTEGDDSSHVAIILLSASITMLLGATSALMLHETFPFKFGDRYV